MFAARCMNGNMDDEKLRIFFEHCLEGKAYDNYLYALFSDLGELERLFPSQLFRDKDKYEEVLSSLFTVIILSGFRFYQMARRNDTSINETNFLKNDTNYYEILRADWIDISAKINTIWSEIKP